MILPIYIYTLTDPTTGRIGYVGKAKNKIKRKWDHIGRPKGELQGKVYKTRNEDHKTYKDFWVRSLLRKGITPIMDIVEVADTTNWKEREVFYVKKFKEEGHKLTNLTPGGDNCYEGATKRVAKIDYITNEVINIYDSIQNAAIINGHKSRSRISMCCSGDTQTSQGYKWRLVDNNGNIIEPVDKKKFKTRKIGQFDIEMTLIKVYPTLTTTHDYTAVHNVC